MRFEINGMALVGVGYLIAAVWVEPTWLAVLGGLVIFVLSVRVWKGPK